MAEILIKDFLNSDMKEFAQYDNVRKIPKLADGLKDSQRKALYGLSVFCNNGQLKVSQIGEMTSERTNYKHGGESLQGAIALMACDYTGSNNMPMFLKDGQFGNRISPDSAAYRYIYVSQHENFRKLFLKKHEISLNYVFDEGEYREPVSYNPLIPLWILNGTIGIGNGYSSTIFCRDVKNIKTYIEAKLNNKNIHTKTIDNLLTPSFNGYTGSIEKVEENRYIQYGVFKRINKNNLIITEVPTKYYLDDYKKILIKLLEDKVIKDFNVIATDNNLTFEIEHPRELSEKTDEQLMTLFKLSVPMKDNVVLFNSDDKLQEYDNIQHALDDFIANRLVEYDKYRLVKIYDIEAKIEFALAKIKFIEFWNSAKDVHKMSKEEILEKINDSIVSDNISSYMQMSISSLTQKHIDSLNADVLKLKDDLQYHKDSTPTSLYLDDLKGL